MDPQCCAEPAAPAGVEAAAAPNGSPTLATGPDFVATATDPVGHALKTETHQMEVLTRGDVRSLARVVDVLALLEMTPEDLHSARHEEGLRIRFRLTADGRRADLCRARIRQLVVVQSLRDSN
jgi:hypothetical protein